MLKIVTGGAVAALMMMAAPSAGVAAEGSKSPAAKQATEQATDFSSRHRRWHRYRYVRPYAYYPRPYYAPSYGYYGPSYGYYGYPYRRGPGITFGFGF